MLDSPLYFSLVFLQVCVAPTVKDAHETKCSLNFGSRAMKIQVTAHVNYEVDYKKLAEALAAKLETLGWHSNFVGEGFFYYVEYHNYLKHLAFIRLSLRFNWPCKKSINLSTRALFSDSHDN